QAALGHRERVVAELDLLGVLVELVHREINDPAESELAIDREIQLPADLQARGAGERRDLPRNTAAEKHGIAVLERELTANLRCALRTEILGDGPRAFIVAEENISQAGLLLVLCPAVHAVAERAAAAGRRRDRPNLHLLIPFDHAGEDLEA